MVCVCVCVQHEGSGVGEGTKLTVQCVGGGVWGGVCVCVGGGAAWGKWCWRGH